MTIPNIIIFTTGASGSSVLAGLLASQGFWLGHETAKLQFDTYENAQLVDLNIQILRKAGYSRRDANDLPPPDVQRIEALIKTEDLGPYTAFVKECENHRPWLWKDPRLAYTMHFWRHIVDVKSVKFVVITREFDQAYAGLIHSRRVYMSPKQYKLINDNYIKSIDLFFKKVGTRSSVSLTFEDLILSPQRMIQQMNEALETSLSVETLERVYKGKLYKKRYHHFDYFRALGKFIIKMAIGDVQRFPRREV